jgi:hypothetical protein
MKKVTVWLLVLGLLVPSTAYLLIEPLKADPSVYLPYITIKSDGTIEPQTEFIERKGNTYTLTKDISGKYAIIIQCSDLVFDGAGYTVNGSSVYDAYSNIGLSLESVKNVTVKNISIIRFLGYAGILLSNCSECRIYNTNTTWILDLSDSQRITISHCYITDTLGLGVSNQVSQSVIKTLKLDNSSSVIENNITDVLIPNGCHGNKIFSNNFFGKNNFIASSEENSWDNGSMGNYWSDYKTKYPAASEISNTGIGDTSYTMNEDNVDNYPLISPFTLKPLLVSTIEPEPEQEHEPLPIIYIASLCILIIAATLFLIYLKIKKSSKCLQIK